MNIRTKLLGLALVLASTAAIAATVDFGGIRLLGSSSGSTTLTAPSSGASIAVTLPGAAGSSGQVLTHGAGNVLAWANRSGTTTTFATTTGTLTSGDCVAFDASGNLAATGAACGSGTGTVSTSGSPTSGNLTKFSGAAVITNGDLSGDCATSGTLVLTCAKLNGVAYGASPSTNTVPVVTSANTITYEAVPNSALANAATTVNGQTCTLGSTCTITASAGTITVGTTTVAGGTTGRPLYDNGGVLGEKTVTGSGSVVLDTSPALTTPDLGTPTAVVLTNGTVLPLGGLATQAANTVVANVSGSTAVPTAASLPSCVDTSGNHLNYTNATGFSCGTSGGTVTTVSVVSANGFAGTVATATTTPAITLTTTITGALKGNGTAISAAACSDLSNGATGCSTATGTSGATIPLLNGTNTWSGVQSVNSGDLALKGASSGTITLNAAAAAGTNTLTLPAGTTDFSATGGTGQVVKQATSGGAFTVGTIACAGLSDGATGCSTATGTSGATIPLLNGTNVWSGQQSASVAALAISTATFTPDGSRNNYSILLVHASCPCTLANPSATPVAGTSGQIVVTQSSSGSDLISTWGSQYITPGGTSTITLSTGANAVDILSYYVIDSTHIAISPSLNFTH